MNLSDLTDPNAVLSTIKEFDTLGRYEFLKKYGFGKARAFFLEKDGKDYDSKAIAGVALGYQYPEHGPLRSSDFSGGEDTVRRKLESLGFQVTVRDSQQAPEEKSIVEILQRVLELQTQWSKDNTPAMAERGDLIRKTGKESLENLLLSIPNVSFIPHVEGRDGIGLKTRVPWIRIYDKELSPSATVGWYIVFLFSFDGQAVYLSLNQGTTAFEKGTFKNRRKSWLEERAIVARSTINAQNIERLLTTIELHDPKGIGEQYEYGNVYAFRYQKQALPSENSLKEDIVVMLKMLSELYDVEKRELAGKEAAVEEEERKGEALTEIIFSVERLSTSYEDIFTSATTLDTKVNEFENLWDLFTTFLQASNLEFDVTTRLDVLAATLSSQFLLFAGPSGTGKSSLARALARFFTTDEAWCTLEARRQWIGIEDAFGYYSHALEGYSMTSNTIDLVGLHKVSENWATHWMKEKRSVDTTIPILLIEEANLSPIEGYLAPVIHGIGAPSTTHVKIPLYSKNLDSVEPSKASSIPSDIILGPFPRFFGTINVDPTSQAPASKISSRASVILLEAEAKFDPVEAARFLQTLNEKDVSDLPTASGQGSAWLGDPASARRSFEAADLKVCTTALDTLLRTINGKANASPIYISRRDLERCANYMAYFLLLGKEVLKLEYDNLSSFAAENALLHIILPSLPAYSFSASVSALLENPTIKAPSEDSTKLGGLLLPRLSRLSMSGLVFNESLDFWTCLS